MLTPQYYSLRGEKALVKFFQVFKVSTLRKIDMCARL